MPLSDLRLPPPEKTELQKAVEEILRDLAPPEPVGFDLRRRPSPKPDYSWLETWKLLPTR